MLLTPGGFERFFKEVGQPVRAGQQAPALTTYEMRRIIDLAPRYGVHILIPAGGPTRVEPRDDLTQHLLARIDSMEPGAIAEFFADDAKLVFGNGEPLVGREAIIAGIRSFFSTIDGLRHRIVREWQIGLAARR